jgi:integral membrane protein
VKAALLRYQVMATVVGVLLVVLVLVGVPLANFDGTPMWHVFPSTPELWAVGSTPHAVGEAITTYLGVAHGWLYMIFLVVAFLLSRKASWSLPFTLTTLACGTIPLVSFWAERRASADVRARLAAEATGPGAGVSTGSGSTAGT